eukprot:TRINITY_DN8824_c0_g1_i1.p1 TRINITY_DN8824_c0_g1~~TRINITY_DN8824_c0_g1_i1.p1  ORF type:complete len:548 (+),score=73.25 TRINITY_DN8824_c0_g1_i1:64-1707(+)
MPTLTIPLCDLDTPEMRERKAKLLDYVGLGEVYEMAESGQPKIPTEWYSRVRVLCMDETDLYQWQPYSDKSSEVGYVSHWNELKTIRMLRKLLIGTPYETDLNQYCKSISPPLRSEPSQIIQYEGDMQHLKNLLESNNMQIDHLSPCLFPETTGRGLIATKDISYPEPILKIPKKLLFNVHTTKDSFLSPLFDLYSLDDDSRLLLFLVYEKFRGNNPSSVSNFCWESFIKVLPEKYDALFFWSESDLRELQGTRLLSSAMEQKQHLREVYDSLFPKLSSAHPDIFTDEIFSWENFMWGRAVFDSRAFVIKIGTEEVTTLVPFAEFVNHTGDTTGHVSFRRYDEDSQCVVLDSLSHIQKGQQLFMNYGPMQNYELVQSYGFVLEDNPLETCVVGVELDTDDELYPIKADAISELGIPSEHMITSNPDNNHYLMAALRVAVCESNEEIQQCTTSFNAIRGPISQRNEQLARELLFYVCQGLLSEYPTSLTEDIDLLDLLKLNKAKPSHTEILSTSHLELALIYRIGQKSLIQKVLDWTGVCLEEAMCED